MKKLKLTLLAALVAFSTSQALARDITVVRTAPPGGGTSSWNDAITQTLNAHGYSAKILGFKTCSEAATWVKANPKEPIIVMGFSDSFILNIADPKNPAGCDLPVNTNSLVGIVGKWYHFICGHTGKGASTEELLASRGVKIGSWNSPVQMKITSQQLTDIGVKDYKLIGYASGKDQLQAFASQDIDYIVLSSETMAASLPEATCFATSAPQSIAAPMNRDSYQQLNANVRNPGSGLWPMILAYNTPINDLRKVFSSESKKSELFDKMASGFLPVTSSIEQQVSELNAIAREVK